MIENQCEQPNVKAERKSPDDPTKAKEKRNWKQEIREWNIEIRPDYLYAPKEVAAVFSVSYDTALRIMERMRRTVNLAQPRSRKRLLRVTGRDLRDYIRNKLS